MESIIDTLLTPGSTPALVIRIVNGSCVGLVIVLGYLIYTDFFGEEMSLNTEAGSLDLNFHLYVMIGLAVCLLLLINWFVAELAAAKKNGKIDTKDKAASGKVQKTD